MCTVITRGSTFFVVYERGSDVISRRKRLARRGSTTRQGEALLVNDRKEHPDVPHPRHAGAEDTVLTDPERSRQNLRAKRPLSHHNRLFKAEEQNSYLVRVLT